MQVVAIVEAAGDVGEEEEGHAEQAQEPQQPKPSRRGLAAKAAPAARDAAAAKVCAIQTLTASHPQAMASTQYMQPLSVRQSAVGDQGRTGSRRWH